MPSPWSPTSTRPSASADDTEKIGCERHLAGTDAASWHASQLRITPGDDRTRGADLGDVNGAGRLPSRVEVREGHHVRITRSEGVSNDHEELRVGRAVGPQPEDAPRMQTARDSPQPRCGVEARVTGMK